MKNLTIESFKDWQKLRTVALSAMFGNVDKHGIFPTSVFFDTIDEAFLSTIRIRDRKIEILESQLADYREQLEKCQRAEDWVSVAERLPKEEDGDEWGLVDVCYFIGNKAPARVHAKWEGVEYFSKGCYWRRRGSLPQLKAT